MPSDRSTERIEEMYHSSDEFKKMIEQFNAPKYSMAFVQALKEATIKCQTTTRPTKDA